MTVAVPVLVQAPSESSTAGPVTSSRAQCPVPGCHKDKSRGHAFEHHLPPIFQEELHGNDITAYRAGTLSMAATWLLGM